VEVDVRVERSAGSLDKRHRRATTVGDAHAAGDAPRPGEDATHEDAQGRRDQRRLAQQQQADRYR
jgi:hypothetical protein